jgi:hypothetical protein
MKLIIKKNPSLMRAREGWVCRVALVWFQQLRVVHIAAGRSCCCCAVGGLSCHPPHCCRRGPPSCRCCHAPRSWCRAPRPSFAFLLPLLMSRWQGQVLGHPVIGGFRQSSSAISTPQSTLQAVARSGGGGCWLGSGIPGLGGLAASFAAGSFPGPLVLVPSSSSPPLAVSVAPEIHPTSSCS